MESKIGNKTHLIKEMLPEHYFAHKNNVLEDFLDIFNIRGLVAGSNLQDQALYFIQAVSGQRQIEDLWIFYAGLLSFQSRPAEVLRLILQDYFSLPVSISNYAPEWVGVIHGYKNCLGVDLIVGKRIWHIQNRFVIHIGPVNYDEFIRLLPNGDMLQAFRILVSSFVGMEFDFSVLLTLPGHAVPKCILHFVEPMRLGWNTWLKYNRDFAKYTVVRLTNGQSVKSIA